MKTYTVIRSSSGQVGVTVKHENGPKQDSYLLKHCILHSPTGMETGYGGSGPADLAASILADHFGVDPGRLDSVWKKGMGYGNDRSMQVIRLHQLFKREFISPRVLSPGQSYEITGTEIAHWYGQQVKP